MKYPRSSRYKRKHQLARSRSRLRSLLGMEHLELRLMLTVCPDGTAPQPGSYAHHETLATTPYVVSTPLCFEGDVAISSNQSVTVNEDIFSATGDVTIGSNTSVAVNAEVTAEAGDIEVTADQSLTVSDSLTSDAGGITLEADDVITIQAPLTAEEAIEVTGHKTIDVDADVVSDNGEVTIEAVHKRLNFGLSALDQLQDLFANGSGQLQVTVGGMSGEVVIQGHEGVSVTAEAGINDDYNIGSNPYYKNIMPVFLELIGKPDLFSLPLSVQVWNPTAEVTATNAKIISDDGEVTVSAVAEANAKGKAVWNRVIGTGSEVGEGLGFDKGGGAAGLFFTDATATVDVIGSVLSGDGVEVSSEVTNEIELEVSAFTNNGLSDTNPSSVAIGFGLTELRTTSTVNVDENSLISSTGSVTVAASGEDDNSNSVKATAYRDGVVGAAAGFTYTDATVSAVVDGKVTMSPDTASSESDSTPATLDFNPALQVDFSNSSVGFSGTPDYQTGDAVVFSSEDNGTIPGLVPDTIYYLIVTAGASPNTYQVQFAETAEDAADNEFISFGAAFPELNNLRTGVDAPITITAVDADDRHLILFGYDQTLDGVALFEDGDTVTFMPSSGRFLGVEDENQNLIGPLAAGNYTVTTVESPLAEQYPLAIELIDAEGQPIALNSASYLESDSGTLYPISAFDMTENTVDLNTVTIDSTTNEKVTTAPGTMVQQGESLVFRSGLISNVPSLQDGATYYAIVDADNEGIIQLGLTASQAESSNPAVQNAQAHLAAMVEGQSVSIPIGNFEAGTGLVFSDDPNLADGTPVVYNAVSEKPIQGLVDQATYLAYNVSNINDNPAAPQSIVALVNTTAVDLSTNADSGSFQLTISDSQGTQGTTASLAYDATAGDLADAIDALQLAGVSVVVSGFGTAQAPWLIQGLDEDAIAVDASQLFLGASPAEVSKQTPELGIVLGSEAVSGTFTLTITDATEQTATSAPLAWNSTPAEIETALNGLLGITVSASGMGNPLSPWRIQGVLPSQVTIDSSLLLDRFGEEVTMEMTSDLQENFWTGQTLQRDAEAFTITGSNADNNDLTLLLTEAAPVVSSDGGALQNGSVSVSAVDAGATQMFSFADGGTFTLTITDPRTGSVTTTAALDWDAAASSIASAIQAATGWGVQVTGSGTLQSPWLISGVGAQQIVVNNDNLLQGAGQTKMLYRSTAASANVVSSDADGGTFTLTFSDGSQSVESAPIPFDASAGDVNEVLRASLSSVNAEVFGLGTAQDPWVIISFAQPIQTGDAMTFHDSWDLPSLGLVNGQTYYAVVKPSALDANMVIVGLAASPADATADPPAFVTLASSVDLVSGPPVVMTGAQESITPVPEALELEISTEVTSSDSSSSASAIGGRPMLGYYTDGAKSAKTRWFSEQPPAGASAVDHEIDERTPADLKTKVNPFSLTFGISILDVTNDVQTVVGNTSVIGVEGSVAITSDLKENVHSSANAGLSKQSSKDHGESTAVAIASAVALLNNSAQAVIESDAEVTGTEGVEVTSEVTYPKRVKVPGSKNGGWDEAYGILKSLALNPTVNAVESWFFNTSTNVGIKGVGTDDAQRLSTILTGSFSVQDITNRNLAQIADGAQINQSLTGYSWYDTSSQTVVTTRDLGELEDTNSVVIEATSDVSQMGIAGQLYIGLNLLTLGTADLANNLLPFRKSSRNAFGGSANFVILSEQTQALLGGTDPDGNVPVNTSTNVTYGGGSEEEKIGLSVTAETATTLIEIGQAAANSSGVGFEASTAYLLMGKNDESDADRGQFTYAEMNTDNLPIELTAISGTAGEVLVKADDLSDLWAVSGAVMLGATKGIGLSASVIELKRDAVAVVGSRTSNSGVKAANRKQAAGDVTIEANLDGTVMPLSLVGAIAASRHGIEEDGRSSVPHADGVEGAASSVTGNWGVGVSGDFAGAWIDDQALAYLNNPGTFSGIEGEVGSLDITAVNDTVMNPIAGQATISIARGDEGALAGIAGSAAVVEVQSNVQALLQYADVEAFEIALEASNDKKIGSCAAGLQVQAPKGTDLAIAGSVVVNTIENTTKASMIDVGEGELLGEVSLTALQEDEVWGAAGTASVTFDRRSDRPRAKTAIGVGMSAVMNQLDNTTTADVSDSELTQSEGAFNVTAEDFTSSRVLSAGVDVTVSAGTAVDIGGMWATNYVSPNTTAQISGSTIENVNTSDALNVVAILAPALTSFAGYFSAEFGKPFSEKPNQIGIGVGSGVVVSRLGPGDDSDPALTTLATVTASVLDRLGEIGVRAYAGALSDETASFVPDQEQVASQVGEESLHALAIAGSVQGQAAAESSFSLGVVVNGAVIVTDLKMDTVASISSNSEINANMSASESMSQVQVLSTNQLSVSTDAGGASVSAGVSASGSSVEIAVGGAENNFMSSNQTIATIEGSSTVVGESVTVDAQHTPDLEHIAFGVAVSVSVSLSSFGAAIGFSGAFLQVDQSDSVWAGISDSHVSVGAALAVQADDQTSMNTSSGSGSLQVSIGSASFSLAPSAVTNKVTVGNQVLAWLGEQPAADGTLVDTSVSADTSTVTAGGSILVSATCDQDIDNTAIAVAVSVAIAPDFDSAAGAGAGASSTVTTNNVVKAAVNGVSDVSVGGTAGLNVSAIDSGSATVTVGSGAADFAWFGASIGISLAEIVNNDQVVAEVQNSMVNTTAAGTPVSITAEDTVTLYTKSVATSLSLSIGAAGAGGNSNITSNANVAASFGANSQLAPSGGVSPGDLGVNAQQAENLHAVIRGGSGGLGSVGVFNSDVMLSGSTGAYLNTENSLDLNDLNVIASTSQTVLSEGSSLTIGGLAGTGENHDVTISEAVSTSLTGNNAAWNVAGNLQVDADSGINATAQTSGSDNAEGVSVSASLMGVGFFKVNSCVAPTVQLTVTDVTLDVQGNSSFMSQSMNQNTTASKSGSGSLIGGDAAKAFSENSPTISLTTAGLDLTGNGNVTFAGVSDGTYSTNANSVYATVFGGSAARSTNESKPSLNVLLDSGTHISSGGTVQVEASNKMLGIGDGTSKKASGFMARVGAGGGATGFGGFSKSEMTSSTEIQLADEVTILANQRGDVLIGASNQWDSTQLTHLGTGGALNDALVESDLESTLHSTIDIGSNVQITAPAGEIGIGTSNYSATTTDADSYTFGLAGGSSSSSTNEMTSSQTVTVGDGSILHAAENIVVTAGQNPLSSAPGTLVDVYAIVTARCAGLIEIPDSTASSESTVTHDLTIGEGTSIISHADVEIGAVPGINNASWYTFSSIDGAKGKVHTGSDGLSEDYGVTMDGDVIAGNLNELSIDIPSVGSDLNVNGLVSEPLSLLTTRQEITSPNPFAATGAFAPFFATYDLDYNAQELLDGLDDISKLILQPSISTSPVPAVTLNGLAAIGGQVIIHAKTLSGEGTATAKLPSLTISNASDAYLVLDGLGVKNSLNMGQVNVMGGAARPAGMTFQQTTGDPTITIAQTYSESVGDVPAGPAIAVTNRIVNNAGSVQITNDEGALVQLAPINAKSISISTPNAAYVVETPADYFGSSGEVKDYWTADTSLVGDGYFESPATTTYEYNPTGTDWDFIGLSGVSANNSGFTSNNPAAPQGKQVGFLQEKGEMSQVIDSVTDGATYVLQFKAAQREGYDEQSFEIALDGQQLCQITPSSSDYESYNCTFEAPSKESPDQEFLELTDGVVDTATAYWYQDLVELPTSGSVAIDFTYQAGGAKAADGVALAFQTVGVNAIGGLGSNLGYTGIASPTAAYQINLYDAGGAHIPGSNFVTNNTSGSYLGTYPVDFTLGNPVQVNLVYDPVQQTVQETLTDTATNDQYSYTHSNVDLSSILGEKTYIGFTGADGGATSTQRVSDFSLSFSEQGLASSIEGFGDWEINGSRILTLTGLQPNGTDETVFLDELMLSTNPTGITPGLNSYVDFYTANLAATTAANQLYLSESGTSNTWSFSDWLYNKGGQEINVNYDVSSGNPGDNYPRKAGDNYGDTQNGNGIIFFGSEIPYLWDSTSTISSGSGNLYDGLGYLDDLQTAQTYSVAASGNSNHDYLNVTQGTGPQHDNVAPGRGIFPAVPADFPTSVTVSSPQTRSLGGSGITAGSIDVSALYIDINGSVDIGVPGKDVSVVLGTDVGQEIASYQYDYDQGFETDKTLSLNDYFGKSGLTGYYDAKTQQVVIDPYVINAGVSTAAFTGAIISTSDSGEITIQSNPGDISIDNQTGYPLVLQNIASAQQEVGGAVLIDDTLTNTKTAYRYDPDNKVRIYQGSSDDSWDALPSVATMDDDTAMFYPGSDLAYDAGDTSVSSVLYQWQTDAWISRELLFSVNSDGSYDLGARAQSDYWKWGRLSHHANNKQTDDGNPFPSSETLLLSDGVTDDANAYWHPDKIDIPDTGELVIKFTYQANADKAADGITFAFQNEAANALGGLGGALGYVGISGPTAAYQINLYDAGGTHIPGSNFVTTNTSGSYSATGAVQVNSGNPIQVSITYDADSHTITELLTDTVTNATYSNLYEDVDLRETLGASSYIGFTGADGGATSIQAVTDFSLTGAGYMVEGVHGWNDLYDQTVVTVESPTSLDSDFQQSVTATITQNVTATTIFSGSSSDAWNYGPSTHWDWTYPTEIFLQIANQVPAANTITIDFSGVANGNLNVNSDAALRMSGNITFPGIVTLSAQDDLTQAMNATVTAQQVTFTSQEGAVGGEDAPLDVTLGKVSEVNVSASEGIYVSVAEEVLVGQITASDGPVTLQAGGNVSPSTASSLIQGTNISLQVDNGSIASQDVPLKIQTQTTQLESGTVVDGLLTASADDSIYLVQESGELRLLSVSTSSPVGVVSLTNVNGGITDGNTSDVFQLNQLSLEQAKELVGRIETAQVNVADDTVTAFNVSVNQSYLQYWTLLDYGSVEGGTFTLTADGVAYYQPQANLYYDVSANSDASEAQVQAYAALLYQQSVTVFENEMVFGSTWMSQPPFAAYDSNYVYSATDEVVSELTYNALDLSNSFAMLSLDALSPRGTSVLGPITPAIQTAFLDLHVGGSIGVPFRILEIDYTDIQSGTLTDEEREMLARATSAGELEFVGVNTNQERVFYSAGDRPSDVTTTGVIVRIDKPLIIDGTADGLVQVQAKDSINLVEYDGDLNILYLETPTTTKLLSETHVVTNPLNSTMAEVGWFADENGVLGYTNSDNVYMATSFTLGSPVFSTGMIENGSFESPDQGAGFTYDPVATSWTFNSESGISGNGSGFTGANPNAPLGEQVAFLQSQGAMSQPIDGLVWGQAYTLQFDVAQRMNYPVPTFTVEIGDQELTTQSPDSTTYETVTIPFVLETTSVELTDGQFSEANASWYQSPLGISADDNFTVEFTYQAGGAKQADGVAFVFQKEGVDAVGLSGSNLGYVGISGPTAAYQINLYDAGGLHIPGSNFVTENTSGSYLSTGEVSFNSGRPIQVQLAFDVKQQTVTETLIDAEEDLQYTHVYTGIDLASLLENSAYIGFTGGDGGASSTQTVTDFRWYRGEQVEVPILDGFGGWNFSKPQTLTFTGVDPSSVDQTAFIDAVNIARSAGILSGDLRVVAGGDIGSSTNPLDVQVGGSVDTFATGDLHLTHQSSNNLRLNELFASGDTFVQAPIANLFAVENLAKGDISGFGDDGTGSDWISAASNDAGVANFEDNTLTLVNDPAPDGAPQSWSSLVATQFEIPVQVENRFIANFVVERYEMTTDFEFLLAASDTNLATLVQTDGTESLDTVAVVFEGQCDGCPSTLGVRYQGNYVSTPVPEELELTPEAQIEVSVIYEALTRTLSVTLSQGDSAFRTDVTELDMFGALGTNRAFVGFRAESDGTEAATYVSGFHFSYGSPTIETNNLTISSGGQIGTPDSPVVVFALGSISSDGDDGVYLTQLKDDFVVDSVSSSQTVQLNAPSGSVVAGSNSSPDSGSGMPGGEGEMGAQSGPHVQAAALFVTSLKHIGASGNPLQLSVEKLGSQTVLGDVYFLQAGDLSIFQPLAVGGTVSLMGATTITVSAQVQAEEDLHLLTQDDAGQIYLISGGSLESNDSEIHLHAEQALMTEIGAVPESWTGFSIVGGRAQLNFGEAHQRFVTYTNADNRYDVDGDGTVALEDALVVVNYIHNHGEGILWGSADKGIPSVDTTFDGRVSLDDVLTVIRKLHQYELAAEGEADERAFAASADTGKDLFGWLESPNAFTSTGLPTVRRQEVAVDVAASLDEVLTAIAWEAAGNRTESPEWYTDLEEDNDMLLDDDLLADIALANED